MEITKLGEIALKAAEQLSIIDSETKNKALLTAAEDLVLYENEI